MMLFSVPIGGARIGEVMTGMCLYLRSLFFIFGISSIYSVQYTPFFIIDSFTINLVITVLKYDLIF